MNNAFVTLECITALSQSRPISAQGIRSAQGDALQVWAPAPALDPELSRGNKRTQLLGMKAKSGDSCAFGDSSRTAIWFLVCSDKESEYVSLVEDIDC
ncbi:uncharacterized protein FMAN_14723 [Fusarium mangiferae]|uniref:Uncharacterized protein n=1 Tax=Fusarium mangiferae TaxID=192010 RepID=A0A1L7U754_FUSMA|nr:uncharacterized protein FMAN_14723 [Fusarium mangiferae]CVL04183.1 uncharacterized protein FMAN_14723 [Fusarium mangiferae]